MNLIIQSLFLVFSPAPSECVRIQLAYARLRLLSAEKELEKAILTREILKSQINRLVTTQKMEDRELAVSQAISDDIAEFKAILGSK